MGGSFMVKSDRDHAAQLLAMASRDHTALAHMLDRKVFSEEVFGFHAQQAIEKTLKAWITVLRLVYPKTHDVSALVKILHDAGADLEAFNELEDYTVFAVQYRYESYDESEEALDRSTVIKETAALISHVRRVVDTA
jgi:HEPN domain-containing protein